MKIHLATALSFSLLATPSFSADLDGTLKKISETGEIVLGIRESSAPISYVDNSQKPVGYAIDICGKLVDAITTRLGRKDIKVLTQPVTGANRIPLLTNGTIDLECGTTTNTLKRQEEVSFGPTYFVSNINAMVKTASGIETLADLNGKNVIVTNGTTSVQLLTDYANAHQMRVNQIVAKDNAEAMLMLQNDRGVAFVLDDVVLYSQRANASDPSAYTVLAKESLREEPYSVVLRKNDPQFKSLIDTALTDLITSGEISTIYEKWFKEPIPPRNVNLDMTISPALKAAFEKPNDKGI